MCGILGFSFFKANQKLSSRILGLKKYIAHRGPDNSGFFINNNLTLLHTRLSIIDLKSGSQPITNDKYVLIANGEIYNDIEIRKANKTYKYSTNSDSESILALYENYGLDGFKKLRGMYAFALYDKISDELIICRDEFGIKPLYFSLHNEGLIFCSEVKPIEIFKSEALNLSCHKIKEYMQLQYCSGTQTIYKGINRVAPGQILVIKRGKIFKSFINPLPKKKVVPKVDDNFINNSLIESISSHLRSDVPYCIFFSGGIDSMLLLHYLKVLKKDKVKAFSISFNDEPNIDIKKIADKYSIDLVTETFSEDDFWEWIFFAAENIDEPVADYAILPTFKLASIASKEFKVVITGEGGDELFGGYGRYKKAQRFFPKRNFLSSKGAFKNIFSDKKFANWDYDIKSNFRSFNKNSHTRLQNYQLFDYENWLPNDLLLKLDRCLMTFGMEGRTPFVDKRLFEKLFYVKDGEKINRGFGKYFIRKFLKEQIPFYNSFEKKRGFSVPIYEWIPNKIKQLQDLLLKQKFLNKYFNSYELKLLCRKVEKNRKFARPLWHIIFFTAWYLVNIKGTKRRGNFFDVLSEYK